MKKFKFINAMVLSAALSGNVLADLNDGLVAYYPFNGNARDESGNFNDGAVHGATLIEDRFGNKKSAYSFDGVNDYISVDDGSQFNFENALSLSLWVRPKGSQNNYAALLDKSHPLNTYGSYKGWVLQQSRNRTNYQYFGFGNGNSWSNTHGDTYKISMESDKWNYLTITKVNTTIKYYLNGNLTVIEHVSNSNISSNYDLSLYIGSARALSRFFQGDLDDIRIYNRALSESEIKQLYQPCQPSIEILLNSNNRVTGDKVVINTHIKGSANLDSSCKPSTVIAKVWAKLPNNSIIPHFKPLTGLNLLPSSDINTKIFEYIFRGAEPIGSYEISGRLLDQLTGDSISTDIETLIFSN